jgi:hypothetical protein
MVLTGAVMILVSAPFLFAQSNTVKLHGLSLYETKHSIPDSTVTSKDTTVTPKKSPTDKKFRMKKSPLTAVLLSAVLPGAGQIYNQSYWKAPIIMGLVGYFGYEYFRQNNLYKDYRDRYNESQTEINPEGDPELKSLREFYRNQRDNFVWYFMIVYVINLADAYIDAHLFDFDVKDEKLSAFGTRNGKTDRTYRLKFHLKF